MSGPISVSVIIPVLNELYGLQKLLPELALIEELREIVVVDDGSVDGSTHFVASMAAENQNIVLVERQQKGLGSAVREGAKRSSSSHAIVMDGDGQHRTEDLLRLISAYKSSPQTDTIVIGSRFLSTSSINEFPVYRLGVSRLLNAILKLTVRNSTSDPLSGFFVAPLPLISSTTTNGFKILYELLLRSPDKPRVDVPIEFSGRLGGKSKARLVELFELMRVAIFFYATKR